MSNDITQERLATTLAGVFDTYVPDATYMEAIQVDFSLPDDAISGTKLAATIVGEDVAETDTSSGAGLSGAKLEGQTAQIHSRNTSYLITAGDERHAANDDWSPIEAKMRGCFNAESARYDNVVYNGFGDEKGIMNIALEAGNIMPNLTKTFKNSNADEIKQIVENLMGLVVERSNKRYRPNTLVMPVAAYVALTTRSFTAAPDVTLLETLQRAGDALNRDRIGTPQEFRIIGTDKAGTKMRAYDRSPQVMRFSVPQSLTFKAPLPTQHGILNKGEFRFLDVEINDTSGIVEVDRVAA